MTAESHHLVADGVFKPKDNAHRNEHHSQSDSNTGNGNTNSWTRHAVFIVAVVDTASKKER